MFSKKNLYTQQVRKYNKL